MPLPNPGPQTEASCSSADSPIVPVKNEMFHGATGFKIENSWFANVGRDLINMTQVVSTQVEGKCDRYMLQTT